MLDNPLGEEKFPNIQSKPPLAQLEAISSCPIACYLGEETDPHLSTTSFQVVEESDEVSPQPPFLQAKQSQVPQLLLIRLLLQTLPQLRCPSLYALQPLNIPLVVGGPTLNTAFEAAFQPLFPKPVALHGVAVAQVQDLALGLVKPHTIDLGPSIQPVQVPLQSLPTLQQINTPTQLGVVCKLTESTLDPFVQIIDKDVKQNWPQHRALGNTACDRLTLCPECSPQGQPPLADGEHPTAQPRRSRERAAVLARPAGPQCPWRGVSPGREREAGTRLTAAGTLCFAVQYECHGEAQLTRMDYSAILTPQRVDKE
ncbi:hypothetical protein QYF61_017646 [Mycteria americana]|uniref:Uncharacterized protein n=1 Tax=Mycteria americana TaxID=33587 RepID=A0AAN7RY06_MYCAM|nr:hypothetical protein QYF61_017646 [Mycteria americana]